MINIPQCLEYGSSFDRQEKWIVGLSIVLVYSVDYALAIDEDVLE